MKFIETLFLLKMGNKMVHRIVTRVPLISADFVVHCTLREF